MVVEGGVMHSLYCACVSFIRALFSTFSKYVCFCWVLFTIVNVFVPKLRLWRIFLLLMLFLHPCHWFLAFFCELVVWLGFTISLPGITTTYICVSLLVVCKRFPASIQGFQEGVIGTIEYPENVGSRSLSLSGKTLFRIRDSDSKNSRATISQWNSSLSTALSSKFGVVFENARIFVDNRMSFFKGLRVNADIK